jgi:hypothetical protein
MNQFFKGLLDAAIQGAASTVVSTKGSDITTKQTGIALLAGGGLAALLYLVSHPSTSPAVKTAVTASIIGEIQAAPAE